MGGEEATLVKAYQPDMPYRVQASDDETGSYAELQKILKVFYRILI